MILMHRPLLGGPRSERRRAENLDRARGSSCRADPPEVWQRRLTGAGWLARMLEQEANAENVAKGRTRSMGLPQPDADRGVYGISVAAELVGMGAQNLRLYEARGLLEPGRTEGGTRRYSTNDLDRLRRIADLLEAGLNLAGIGMVLDLEAQNTHLRVEKERQQWLKTASTPATRSLKRTSSNNTPRSTRTR